MDRVRSLRKIPTRLRRTNFCTSSSHFAPSFVSQPNGLECTQIVRNAPKRQFRVQWGGSGAFRFVLSFMRQPKGSECTQIVQNARKHQLLSNGVDPMRSLRKMPTRLRGTNFCTSSSRFAPSFVRQQNGPKCTQIVRNTLKH